MDSNHDADRLFPTSEHLLSSIIFYYSALMPVKNTSLPPNVPFNDAHDLFLRRILLNHHLRQYPPSESYQQTFWKWALLQLENLGRGDEDNEIDERIYVHYSSLRPENRSATPPNSFVTHYWQFPETHGRPIGEELYETITLLESLTTVEAGTTGLRTWRASLVLAQYLIQHSYLVDTSNVLELGSGTGFIGMLVASLQLHAAHLHADRKIPSVCMTDVNSNVLARCQSNVGLSCNRTSSHPNIHYRLLDWADSLSSPENVKPFFDEIKADVVLGADIVFDPVLVPPLVETISLALSSQRTRLALIALTVRNEETLAYFLDEIGKALQVKEMVHKTIGNLPLQLPDLVDAGLQVKIFSVTRRRDA